MFPRQDRDTPTGGYSRSGISGTGTTGSVVKIRLPASSSTATPVNGPGAVQRTNPTKSDVSVAGEHLLDEPGVLPVGLQRDLHLFEHGALFHQPAAHHQLFRFQVADGCRRADSSRLAASWENSIPTG